MKLKKFNYFNEKIISENFSKEDLKKAFEDGKKYGRYQIPKHENYGDFDNWFTKNYKSNENILDDEDTNENKWEVKLNGNTDSYWEYKHDAIDQIIEILDTNGDENGLDGFKDEDDYEMSKGEIADMLDDMDESDFYDKLEELKEFVGYEDDIRLINIADEDEIEFLE